MGRYLSFLRCLSVNVFCAHAVLQNSIEPPPPSPPGRFDAVAAVRVPSPAPSGASPVPPSLSLPLLNAVRGRSGLRWIGTHEKREREREGDCGRAVAALRFACSSAGSCVCVVDEEEEACSECQQIRKCLLSCLYSPMWTCRFGLPPPPGIASPFMENDIAAQTI